MPVRAKSNDGVSHAASRGCMMTSQGTPASSAGKTNQNDPRASPKRLEQVFTKPGDGYKCAAPNPRDRGEYGLCAPQNGQNRTGTGNVRGHSEHVMLLAAGSAPEGTDAVDSGGG